MKSGRAAVIGAGLGGLSAAVRLASAGLRVEVFEKNGGPGGKANNLECGGYRFDTGPSLLTLPSVLEQLFEEAGEKLEDHLDPVKLDIICRYFYHDGTVIDAYSDAGRFGDEVEKKTGDFAESVRRYLEYCRKIYEITYQTFLYHCLCEPSRIFSPDTWKAVLRVGGIDFNRTMDQANRSFFRDPKTVQLFNRYATYNGSDPYVTPATFNLIQHVEYNIGGYAVKGGIYSIPREIYRLARRKGVVFHFDTEVERIIHSGGRVRGIRVSGEEIPFDIVVSNSDVSVTYRDLLNDTESGPAKRYAKLEPSSSAIVFYWGMKKSFPSLEVNNIFFSPDYPAEFEDIFRKRRVPRDPTVYINITSKVDPGDAPEGGENWFVLVNAPYDEGQDWEEERKSARDGAIRRISEALGEDIEPLISCEDHLDPILIEKRYGTLHGSIYGISSNTKGAAFMRQQNRSKRYKGLYFASGSAHPGGGMPLVILSGKITSDLILKQSKQNKNNHSVFNQSIEHRP